MDQEMQELLAIYEQQSKDKKDADERKGQNYDFELIECLGLEDRKNKVFRIIGRGVQNRKFSTDAKLVMQSSILKDDNKGYCKINWPTIYEEKKGNYIPDPDFILTKLYFEVRKGKWKKYDDGHVNEKTKKDGEMEYFHKDTKIFKRIESNMRDNPSPKEFAPSFYPSQRVALNVIDRHDDWCKVNKHTKELSSKISIQEKKNDKNESVILKFPELGIPKACYNTIIDHYLKTSGSWRDVDTVIMKDVENKKYDVMDAYDERYLKGVESIASKDPLSEEELQYVMYDFDKLYSVSSYNKLKKNLSGLFKLCDSELGTNFYDELLILCKKEDEETKAKEEAEKANKPQEDAQQDTSEKSVSNEPKRSRQPQIQKEESKSSKSISELCIENFPSWNKVPQNEKEIIIKCISEFKGTVPVYTREAGDVVCNDPNCKFKDTNDETTYPSSVFICPVCGNDASK